MELDINSTLMIPMGVYITFKVNSIIDQQTALARIQACIEEIRIWMIPPKLMMNDSKTEFVIVVSAGSLDKVSFDTITIHYYR